jgi:hypothetical protein
MKSVHTVAISLLAVICAQVPVKAQNSGSNPQQNATKLQGPDPTPPERLPPPPDEPGKFWAYCNTVPGLCVVYDYNAIAPDTACYCGQYPGKTWAHR